MAFAGLVSISAVGRGFFGLADGAILWPLTAIIGPALIGVIGVSVSILFANVAKNHIAGMIMRLTQRIGQTTYPIYLFHAYFLTIIAMIAGRVNPGAIPIAVITIGIPCSVIIPAHNQVLFDHVLNRYHDQKVANDPGQRSSG